MEDSKTVVFISNQSWVFINIKYIVTTIRSFMKALMRTTKKVTIKDTTKKTRNQRLSIQEKIQTQRKQERVGQKS